MLENKIIKMYQSGCSAREVAEIFQLSIDDVYRILRQHQVPRRSAAQTNDLRFRKTSLSFLPLSELSEVRKLLQTAALALYWGEGAKTHHTVDLANSDPAVLQVFLRYLREILRIDESRLRVYLYCFTGDDHEALKRFWSDSLCVPLSQFQKPYVRSTVPGNRVMKYGVAHIRYADRRLLEYILAEIKVLKSWAGSEVVKRTTL